MAGKTTGGRVFKLGQSPSPSRCAHPDQLVNTTAGLERTVCLRCGEVTVKHLSELTGDLERSRFARPADERRH